MNAQVQKVKIDKIKIRKPKSTERTFNKKMATAIAESIKVDGQLSPVLLRKHPTEEGYYEQVAGLHRIYAVGQILKWEEIDAFVIECDEGARKMITIAENAFRTPLSKEQFYAAISAWRKHYEGNTNYKHGAAGGKATAAKAEAKSKPEEDDNPLLKFEAVQTGEPAPRVCQDYCG